MFMGVVGVVVVLTSQYLLLPFSSDPYVAWLASMYLILGGLSRPELASSMAFGVGISESGNIRVSMTSNTAGL